jgi:lipoprotein-anchoring transpeptidase ErfK/SrfK
MDLMKHFRIFLGLILIIGLNGCDCALAIPHVPPKQVKEHIASLGVKPTPHIVVVDTKKQTLSLVHNDQIKKIYKISTSKKGLGQIANTYQTPQGLHRINEKIGEGIPPYGIFHRRQFVGTWRKQPRHAHLKDYISTRILRLEGLQPGFNKGKDRWGRLVDSETRAIYIHGTTMEWKLGAPSGKGCVHMSAKDVIHFFNEVPVGTLVWID